MLQYGIYRFTLPRCVPGSRALVPTIFSQFDGWAFCPTDKTLQLEFYIDPPYQVQLIELGIKRLARNIRQHLALRPEVTIRFMDWERRDMLVEDQEGVVRARY